MILPPLSIDISGEWSPRQAEAVLSVVASEAGAMGVTLQQIDVTANGGPQRFLIRALCREHLQQVGPDALYLGIRHCGGCPLCGSIVVTFRADFSTLDRLVADSLETIRAFAGSATEASADVHRLAASFKDSARKAKA